MVDGLRETHMNISGVATNIAVVVEGRERESKGNIKNIYSPKYHQKL